MISGYSCFRIFVPLKLHFSSFSTYDCIKYRFKTMATSERQWTTLQRHKQRMYEKVGSWFNDPVSMIRYFIANLSDLRTDPHQSIADLFLNKEETFKVFRTSEGTLKGLLTYHLENDIMALHDRILVTETIQNGLDDLLCSNDNGRLPIIVQMLMHHQIQKETLIMIDSVRPFLDQIATNDPLYQTRYKSKLCGYRNLLLESGLYSVLGTPHAREKTEEILSLHFNETKENRGK